MNGMNFVWAPEGMTVEELDRHCQDILIAFYKRPQMLLYYLKMTLAYPNHLWRLLRFLAGFAKAKLKSLLSGQGGLLVKPSPHLD